MTDLVSLRVNGADYAGWLDVEITAGIERQARDFKLSITRSWPNAPANVRRVKQGDLCELYIGADKVLTGFVDAMPIGYTSSSISLSITGRSKTADLVDCSADFASGQWRNRKIEKIAADLASSYGIKVIADIDTGALISDHQIDTGETAFESIGRLLLLRQMLSTDDAEGNLHLISAGSGGLANTALVFGKNILAASIGNDYKDVFSDYVVKGQRAGNDYDSAESVASVSAVASDATLARHRKTIIMLNGNATQQDCSQRAKYERLYRAAKAIETVYTVQGWRQDDGTLWKPNQMVSVSDPIIGFERTLLITEVSYRLSESDGTTCDIKVAPKEGFIPSPEVAKKESDKKSGKASAGWGDVRAAI